MSDLRLLCVHPHPDDESIACGGILARYVEEDLGVMVVTCTRGEEGDNLAGIDLGDDDLPTHRLRELEAALGVLGVDEHRFLGYRDSGMVDTPGNAHPDSFHQADLYAAAARLARIIRGFRPHVVVSDDARGTYGHPDHVKAHRVTERAVAMARDDWWRTPDDGAAWSVDKRYVHTLSRSRLRDMHTRLRAAGLDSPFGEEAEPTNEDMPFGAPDELVTTRVDVRRWLDRKRAAMAAHRTQIGADSFFLNVPEEVAADTFGVEEFTLLTSDVAREGIEDDLFAGLR